MEMPAQQQIRWALAIAGSALVLLAVGFAIGHSGGPDLDAARAKGAAAGSVAGAKQGKSQGYRAGHRKGYRTSYKAAFERAKRGD